MTPERRIEIARGIESLLCDGEAYVVFIFSPTGDRKSQVHAGTNMDCREVPFVVLDMAKMIFKGDLTFSANPPQETPDGG